MKNKISVFKILVLIRKKIVFSFLLVIFFAQTIATGQVVKRRSDCFFGLHFDFHATKNDSKIGASLTSKNVGAFLDQVKPDFIQVDTKGHPGIASYPTKIGKSAGIIKDPLKVFRKATADRGIGLYSHFSGVVDMLAVKNHPEWARTNVDGTRDASSTSIFGGYCDQYFIPQIEELIKNYKIDGIWVDGECWGVQPDFSANAKKQYFDATKKEAVLDNSYMQFTRNAFHKYLAHYTSVLHKYNPKFQIASNWAFSSYMPGVIDAQVDYLSGDIVKDGGSTIEFESRVMANQRKPWDLMLWGFMGDKNGKGHYWKSARMLKQKGAQIISQGGAYQVYITQNRDASLPISTIPVLKDVAQFCRARKPYSFKLKNVPQVAVLLPKSGHDYDLGTTVAFNQDNGGNDNIKGAISMLLNSMYTVQVVQEHNLVSEISNYPFLVVTEWNYLSTVTIKNIEDYVYKGGKVLVIGNITCNLFSRILALGNNITINNTFKYPVRKKIFGKGVIIGVEGNICLNYLNAPNEQIRNSVASIVKISVSYRNNTKYIHVVNVNDSWTILNNDQMVYNLPSIGKISFSYASNIRPKQVLLQPENVPLKFTYKNEKVNFSISKLDIYSVIEVKL
jgi:hypothetical protein